jgi:hypothetical protein
MSQKELAVELPFEQPLSCDPLRWSNLASAIADPDAGMGWPVLIIITESGVHHFTRESSSW